MTREEELDWLCRLRSEIYVYMPKEWLIPMNNALDMVIKDLEQESKTGYNGCKDCKYETYPDFYYPCCDCKHNYVNKWQMKEGD